MLLIFVWWVVGVGWVLSYWLCYLRFVSFLLLVRVGLCIYMCI